MFGGHFVYRYCLSVALFSASFTLSVSLTQQQEFHRKNFTSPLIEGSDFKHVGDMTIFQGQYEADEVGTRQERHVTTSSFAKWPQGIVPYEISSQFSSSQRRVILRAIQHWEENTCVDFRPKVSSDVYSIYIMRDSGCYSFVGRLSRRYQPQGVSLGTGCVYDGVVIHELGHAIGFYHEHTRPDRDNYIDVIYDNIQRGFEDQFYKYRPGQTDTLGLGYDLQSIMHYDRNTFSRDGSDTIRPKDQTVTSFGNARQLSSLDIAKANRFYNCAPPPPPCGGVLNTASGSFQSPNWPATYPVNIDCEWRIQLPDARKVVELTCGHQPFGIAGDLPGCDKDYLKLYDGHSKQDTSHGPYCHFIPPDTVRMSSNLAMAVFHAGPSHSSSRLGFKCTFQSVEAPTIPPPCGGVLNTASGSFQTPNWPATYPVNIDCEWRIQLPDARKLVELKCDHQPFGIAGGLPDCSLDYLKLYDGHDSTRDTSYGPFCHFTPPEVLKMSSNLVMAVFHAGPTHSPSRRGFRCTFESVEVPTTLPPTPPPTIPPPCGGVLNTASGSFQTPNWPATYPINVDCEWRIELPDAGKLVELKCDHQPFGIAGGLPDCSLDYLKLYDGHDSTRDTSYGPFCHYTPPEILKMSSNLAMAVFHAGPSHSPSRRGFRCTFQSVEAPTPPTTLPPTPPPTTPPPTPPPTTPPICGGELKTTSGSFQSPNWPATYPVDIDCRWTIELPDRTKLVEIDCNIDPFGIAGSYPACDRDHLKFYDGHSVQDESYGPYCYFTPPETLKMSSSLAMAVFHAGPSHNPSRQGFKCTFRSLDGPTTPPLPPSPLTTTPPPSTEAPAPSTTSVSPLTTASSSPPPTPSTALPPLPTTSTPGNCPLRIVPTNPPGTYFCDSFMNPGTYFGLPGFPSLVSQLTPSECDWTIIAPSGPTLYQVRVTYLDLPDSSDCATHSLTVYDGPNQNFEQLAKFCGNICEEQVVQISGKFAFIKVHMDTKGAFRGIQAIMEEVA